MNTNKNSYTIIYAAVMVVIVAFLLAFVSSALKPTQDQNEALDKKKQILASLNIRNITSPEEVEKTYAEVIVADMVIDAQGNQVDAGTQKDQAAFLMKNSEISADRLPIYQCKVGGETKYVVPMTGRGLWGGLWGYLAINADLQTVYGAYFSHESETAGLGALIAEEKFQDQFKGKHLFAANDSDHVALTVVKHGKVEAGSENVQVDGVTGATLTSNGVADMVHTGLQNYVPYFKLIKH